MINVVNWFEIPTNDLERAVKFYEAMMATRLKREVFGAREHAMFVGSQDGAGGALTNDPSCKPSCDGTLVYLNAQRDLDGCLERATKAGGRVVLPKTDIGDPGFIAIVADTEGNRVALHMER